MTSKLAKNYVELRLRDFLNELLGYESSSETVKLTELFWILYDEVNERPAPTMRGYDRVPSGVPG